MIHKNKERCVTSYQDNNGYQRIIQFYDFTALDGTYLTPFSMTFTIAKKLQKAIAESAPIDLRIYNNGLEIMNDADKIRLLQDLVLFEVRTMTDRIAIPVPSTKTKVIEEEEKLKAKLSAVWNYKIAHGLPIKKYEALKELLES